MINFVAPIILALLVIWTLIRGRLSALFLFLLFLLFPATTPFFTDFFGFSYFTLQNHFLQLDSRIAEASTLFALFAVCILLAYFLAAQARSVFPTSRQLMPRLILLPSQVAPIAILAVSFLAFFTLEGGNLITSTYQDIKENNSEFSSTLNQFYNIFFCCFLYSTYLKQSGLFSTAKVPRSTMFAWAICVFLLLLISRRTLVLGVVFTILLILKPKLKLPTILFGVFLIFVVWFIGEVRNVGLAAAILEGAPFIAQRDVFSLPGGASQLFSSTLSILYLEDLGRLPTLPFLDWLSGKYESSIIENSSLAYNGGMSISTVIYANFGIIGVCVGGLLFGFYLNGLDHRYYRRNFTLPDIAFILTLPNLVWYHPIGPIKLMIATFILHQFLLLTVPTKRGAYETS